MNTQIYLLNFFLLFAITAFGQQSRFDERYMEVSVSLIATDIQEALRVSDSLLTVAKTDEQRAKAFMLSATVHQNLGSHAFAIQQAIRADEIAKASLYPTWQSTIAGFLATSFRQAGLLQVAKRYIDQAEAANEKLVTDKSYTLTKINILHERVFQAFGKNDYSAGKEFLKQAAQHITLSTGDDMRSRLIKATNHQLFGMCYLRLGQLEKAEEMYLSSLEQIGDDRNNLRPYIYRGLAEVAMERGELDKAGEFLALMNPYLESGQFKELIAHAYYSNAKYYWNRDDTAKAKEYGRLYISTKAEQAREAGTVADELYEGLRLSSESNGKKLRTAMIVLFCLVLLSLSLIVYIVFSRPRQTISQYARDSMNAQEVELKEEDKETALPRPKTVNISQETEKRLIQAIDRWEEQLLFLDKEVTISSLAAELSTNQRYISYMINKHKGVDFSSYIQACRIRFIVERMKADPSLLEYKLARLADMCGFTNLSKFSTAFKAETGLPPSAFVHLLKKDQNRKEASIDI